MLSTRARCSTGLSPKVRAKDGIVVRHTRRSFAQHVNISSTANVYPSRHFACATLVVGAIDQKAAHAHLAQLGEADPLRAVGRA